MANKYEGLTSSLTSEQMRKISVIVPWRSDGAERLRNWEFIKRNYWDKWEFQLCVGEQTDDLPFNNSMCQNTAFAKATGEIVMSFGADCIPDIRAIEWAVNALYSNKSWVEVYGSTSYFGRIDSERFIRGELNVDVESPTLPFCTGVLAMWRWVWPGMDERFEGWGYEDAAFRHALWKFYGDTVRSPWELKCLWHETTQRVAGGSNEELIKEYLKCETRQEMTKYYRDKGMW